MPTEYDILKKLAKGLNNEPKGKSGKDENSKGKQEVETTEYPAIPLRTFETIMSDTTNQEKKD